MWHRGWSGRSHTVERDVVVTSVVPDLARLAVVLVVHEPDVDEGLADVVGVFAAGSVSVVEEDSEDAPLAGGVGDLVVDGGAEHVEDPLAGGAHVRVLLHAHLEVWVEDGLGDVGVSEEGPGEPVIANRDPLETASIEEETRAPDEGVEVVVERGLPTVANVSVHIPIEVEKAKVPVSPCESGDFLFCGMRGSGDSGGGCDSFHFIEKLNHKV